MHQEPYIYRQPDYDGGFVYTCIEDEHIVRRDNDWNMLSSCPINHVQKGVETKYGQVQAVIGDRVLLKSHTGEILNCGKELLNHSIIKEKLKTEYLIKSMKAQFRGGEELNKGIFKFNLFGRRPNRPTDKPPKLEGDETEKAPEGGVAWNVKGGQKPGHKYIERRPSKTNPDKYIYLYELPSGKREWRNDEGEEVEENTGQSYEDFNIDDFIKINDGHYIIKDIGEKYIGVEDKRGNKFHIDKEERRKIAEYENSLNVGDDYKSEDPRFDGMKVTGFSDKYVMLMNKEGTQQFLVNRADSVRFSREGEVANPYEFDENYRILQKELAERGYNQTDINKWEVTVPIGFNKIHMERGVNHDTGKWYHKFNGQDEYRVSLDGKEYLLDGLLDKKNVALIDPETNEILKTTLSELAAGVTSDPSTSQFSTEVADGKFWEGDPHADIMDYIDSVKDHNPTIPEIVDATGKSLQEVQGAIFDYTMSNELKMDGTLQDGSFSIGKPSKDRQKKAGAEPKKRGRKSKDEKEAELERQRSLQAKALEEKSKQNKLEAVNRLKQNPEYIASRESKLKEGFTETGRHNIVKKTQNVNNVPYEITQEFNEQTGMWEGKVTKGRYKTVTVDGNSYPITNITDRGIEYVDSQLDETTGEVVPFGYSKTWEELKEKNGTRLFEPTEGKGLISTHKPKMVSFGQNDKEEYTLEVVEKKDLIPSHTVDNTANPDYQIVRAQNRDRTKASSKEQVFQIAANPEFDRLEAAPEANQGAPIVDDNYNVIAGNGRALGLITHYDSTNVTDSQYRQSLLYRAEELGFNPDDIASMEEPVLIRKVKVTPERAVVLGNLSNRPTALHQTKGEKAQSVIMTMKPHQIQKIGDMISSIPNYEDMTLAEIVAKKGKDIIMYLVSNGVLQQSEVGDYYDNEKNTADEDQKRNVASLLTQMTVGNAADQFANIPDSAKRGITSASPKLIPMIRTKGDLRNTLADAIHLADMHMKEILNDEKQGSKVPLRRDDTKGFLDRVTEPMFEEMRASASPQAIALYESLMKDSQNEIRDKISKYIALQQDGLFGEGVSPEEAFAKTFTINYPDGINHDPANPKPVFSHIKDKEAEGEEEQASAPTQQESLQAAQQDTGVRLSKDDYGLLRENPKTGKKEHTEIAKTPISQINQKDVVDFANSHIKSMGMEPDAESVQRLIEKHKDYDLVDFKMVLNNNIAINRTTNPNDTFVYGNSSKINNEAQKPEAPKQKKKPFTTFNKMANEKVSDIDDNGLTDYIRYGLSTKNVGYKESAVKEFIEDHKNLTLSEFEDKLTEQINSVKSITKGGSDFFYSKKQEVYPGEQWGKLGMSPTRNPFAIGRTRLGKEDYDGGNGNITNGKVGKEALWYIHYQDVFDYAKNRLTSVMSDYGIKKLIDENKSKTLKEFAETIDNVLSSKPAEAPNNPFDYDGIAASVSTIFDEDPAPKKQEDEDIDFTPIEIPDVDFDFGDDDKPKEEKPKKKADFNFTYGDDTKKPEEKKPEPPKPKKVEEMTDDDLPPYLKDHLKTELDKIKEYAYQRNGGDYNIPPVASEQTTESKYIRKRLEQAVHERNLELEDKRHESHRFRFSNSGTHNEVDGRMEHLGAQRKDDEGLHHSFGKEYYHPELWDRKTKNHDELQKHAEEAKQEITKRGQELLPQITELTKETFSKKNVELDSKVIEDVVKHALRDAAPINDPKRIEDFSKSIGNTIAYTIKQGNEAGVTFEDSDYKEIIDHVKGSLLGSDWTSAQKKLKEIVGTKVNLHPNAIAKHLKEQYEKNGVDLDDDKIAEDGKFFSNAAKEQGHSHEKLYKEILPHHIKKMQREHPKEQDLSEGGFF